MRQWIMGYLRNLNLALSYLLRTQPLFKYHTRLWLGLSSSHGWYAIVHIVSTSASVSKETAICLTDENMYNQHPFEMKQSKRVGSIPNRCRSEGLYCVGFYPSAGKMALSVVNVVHCDHLLRNVKMLDRNIWTSVIYVSNNDGARNIEIDNASSYWQ